MFGEEKYFFIVQRVIFKLIGFWPEGEEFLAWQMSLAIFNALEILFFASFQVNFCIKNFDNLIELLNGFTPLVTQIITALKIFILIARRNDFKRILDALRESFLKGEFIIFSKVGLVLLLFLFTDTDEDSRRINSNMSKFSFLAAIVPSFFALNTGGFFTVLPLIIDIYLSSNGQDRLYGLPFKSEYKID
jgi:hypothetical protein